MLGERKAVMVDPQMGPRWMGDPWMGRRWWREGEAPHLDPWAGWCGEQGARAGTARCCTCKASNGKRDQGHRNLGWDVGRTEHPTVQLDPDFLEAELVENLM